LPTTQQKPRTKVRGFLLAHASSSLDGFVANLLGFATERVHFYRVKHLLFFAFFVVCSLIASSPSMAQTFSGFYLETLDQPYVPLAEGTALNSENWDYNGGWDDPEFLVSIGFDFDFAGTVISDMVQVEQGSTFFASQDGYDYGYDAALFYLLGEIDLADLGLTGTDSIGASTIQWHTSGEPGQQVFTLDYANAGLYEEVFSDGVNDTYSSLNVQFRLFESTGVLEIHFGPSSLTDFGFAVLEDEELSGWHGLLPSYEALYYDGGFIFTNINSELMYDDLDFAYDGGIPFEGLPAEGRLFRYTPVISGCDIETACNYDSMVNYSVPADCTFPETPGMDCDGECLVDADEDGICDATLGCTEGTACNYNPEATEDDDSCDVPEPGYGCDGECLSDVDGDGVCDANEMAGCEDPAACNYVESPTDLESCDYPETYYDCEGECLMDTDGDGVCDELEELGCTDENACNYQWWATDDDGSCFDSLPVTLFGDTVVSVGDTIVVSTDGPVNYPGAVYPSYEAGTLDLLEVTELTIVAVVLEGFESCQFWFYSVEVGCNGDTLTVLLNSNASSVTELEGAIQLYPNPVSSSLTLDVPQGWASGVDVRMVNAIGQTVWSERLSPGRQILDVSDLPNGMHLLMYEDRTQRVLIQR